MSDMKDQHVGSDGAIVNPADTTPARVEGQPSPELRGTPQGQDGDGAATPRFRVWSYVRPSGHSKSGGFLRGTSAPITEWAYALVDDDAAPVVVYMVSAAKNGFPSRAAAIAAAKLADNERACRRGCGGGA